VGERDVDKLEELFADLWQVPRFAGLRHGFRPNIDCFHTDDPHALTVVAELPGVDPQSIRVAVGENGVLTIVLPVAARAARGRIAIEVWRS
jgi:HSP20 family molecular chaperone IbpA